MLGNRNNLFALDPAAVQYSLFSFRDSNWDQTHRTLTCINDGGKVGNVKSALDFIEAYLGKYKVYPYKTSGRSGSAYLTVIDDSVYPTVAWSHDFIKPLFLTDLIQYCGEKPENFNMVSRPASAEDKPKRTPQR